MKPSDMKPSPIDAVIVCAMTEEVAPFLDLATTEGGAHLPKLDSPDLTLGGASAWAVRTQRCALLVVRAGIGGANAAAAAALALNLTGANLLISSGSCGGLAEDVEVGNVLVGSSCRYAMVDATAFGYALGQVPGEKAEYAPAPALLKLAEAAGARAGQMLTSDVFVTAKNVSEFRGRFPKALGTDMESAALAQIADKFGSHFLTIRGVSDLCGPDAAKENHRSAGEVSQLASEVVLKVVHTYARAASAANKSA